MANNLYIKAKASTTSISTATLMKTGQTTSYRTGDDGNIQSGRATNFNTLSTNNPFGNTNRFTDELGGQNYVKNIVIDWSTYNGSNVLGWCRTKQGSGTVWNTAIDNALAFSIVGYTSGWKMANVMEYMSISDFSKTIVNKFNYTPFNITNGDYWSSNTDANTTANAYYIPNSTTLYIYTVGKTTGIQYLVNRYFTVSGTTLS